MRDCGSGADFEEAVRRAYTALVENRLPQAGRCRGWPWTTRAEFEALLHRHLSDGCSAEARDLLDMILALDVGERLLEGDLRWTALRAREVALQDVGPRGSA